ncbi:MAG TPA: MmcQ/YjbR family DNA-binding protein [Candidatus Eremiobacteraceae bacterium]|jgi:predicted DNA-binding protein (MmcQ/YjbR family)|nr:MmcQ/YjbR family DNA-binding protein [Candidatus Eremiobacteraceae bacterium]
MHAEELRKHCLSFPGVTEHQIWGNDLTFKVGNKMFAHTVLEVAPVWLSFKTSDEKFAELLERQDVIPAPYLARAKWVALETREAIPASELRELLREAYDLVVAKLPKKIQANLATKSKPKRPAKKKKIPKAKRRKPRR